MSNLDEYLRGRWAGPIVHYDPNMSDVVRASPAVQSLPLGQSNLRFYPEQGVSYVLEMFEDGGEWTVVDGECKRRNGETLCG